MKLFKKTPPNERWENIGISVCKKCGNHPVLRPIAADMNAVFCPECRVISEARYRFEAIDNWNKHNKTIVNEF